MSRAKAIQIYLMWNESSDLLLSYNIHTVPDRGMDKWTDKWIDGKKSIVPLFSFGKGGKLIRIQLVKGQQPVILVSETGLSLIDSSSIMASQEHHTPQKPMQYRKYLQNWNLTKLFFFIKLFLTVQSFEMVQCISAVLTSSMKNVKLIVLLKWML